MPESIFGRPSEHLLPSHRPDSAEGSPVASDPHRAPVPPAPPPFSEFRFNSIGRKPELLSRISLDHADYHSPTPSPTSTPPPAFISDDAFQSKSSSRPTLLQQLAGNDFDPTSTSGASGWHVSTSQPSGSLASRIQMSGSPPNDNANTAYGTASGFPQPLLRVNSARRGTGDASLIPPVEVLHPPPESSPTAPASLAPALESVRVHSPKFSTLLMDTTSMRVSRLPTPTVSMNAASGKQAEPIPSFAVADATMQEVQPSPSAVAAIDSVVARQERLQSISASLAKPVPPPSSHSPSPALSLTQANDNVALDQPTQPQLAPAPIVLYHPYSANQSSGQVGLSINDVSMDTNASSLALVPPPTTFIQERQAQHRTIIEAVQNFTAVVDAFHRTQIDNENALALQIRTLEEQRVAFEHMKRAQEATLQQQFQELRQKHEELIAKGASLASLERESKAKEEARKAMLAKRQAQEEEERTAETKRYQEQIAAAVKELEEHKTWKAEGLLGQLANEPIPDDLPTEPQEGMNEEELVTIKSRTELLRAVKQLRRMHTENVEKLQESNRTLRRLEEERKQRQAEEAERRRITEEERVRAHAEMERARQAQDEQRRQLEAERKRQEDENNREPVRLLIQQRAHVEAQAQSLKHTETVNAQTPQHRSRPEEASASQQQATADTRIRAARDTNSLSAVAANAMSVDEDGRASIPYSAVPLPIIRTSPGGSQSATSPPRQKKDAPISGGVMLAVPTPQAGGGHLPAKLSAIPPLLSSSHDVAENAPNPTRTPPAQFASERSRVVNPDIRPTSDHKPAFPRTPKSRTVLDPMSGGSQELNIGPLTGVSPTQRDVNLRHLKKSRGRIEESDSGDRSVRMIDVKNEDNSHPFLKREEHDGQSRELVQASLSTNLPASLPSRPSIIPPPRPRMPRKHGVPPKSQTDSSSSYPHKGNKLSLTKGKAEVTTDKQPQEAPSRGSPSSLAMNAPVQLPVPTVATNSLLLAPVYPEAQPTEPHIDAGERPLQGRAENYNTTSREPASATLSHELDGEDLSRSNRRFTDEHHRARNGNNSRRLSDHYSPTYATFRSTITSPTQSHRSIDSWRPPNSSNVPRVESIHATSPIAGRKRSSDFNDNEYVPRARRQRGDAWMPQDHDRDRVDSYRSHWDRHLDSEVDERRATYRASPSPPHHIRPVSFDNIRPWPPSTFEDDLVTQPVRWEQSRSRAENDDTYQRYQPSASGYNAVVDQHHTDNVRVGQTYEPMTEERMAMEPDPPLLARMSHTQRFSVPNNPRGRGRGESSRGRGDSWRSRGRGPARSGPPLLDRLTSRPLGERVT